jgi:hypothetical protein
MAKRKRAKRFPGGYVIVPKAILNAPAWRAMSPWARLLWIDMRGWLRNDDLNNGKLFRSCRDAAKTLGFDKKTVARAFAENEHFGFVRRTADGFLGGDGHGIAAHYRFTDLVYGTQPPTRDFEKWEGSPFVHRPRRGAQKKQNPVPSGGTPRTVRRYIRKAKQGGAVCTVQRYIGEDANCTAERYISSLPLPEAGKEELQGSLTARAPARAGGAGSSPAPVAKEEA